MRSRTATLLFALVSITLWSGCAAVLHKSSYDEYRYGPVPQPAAAPVQRPITPRPTGFANGESEWGVGLRPAPGFALGEGAATVHPTVGASYLKFDGGHDEFFDFGGQIRTPVSKKPSGDPGVWVGAEGTYTVLRTSVGGFSSSTNGWSANGLVGFPLERSKWGLSLYGAAGIVKFSGTPGLSVRVGVDSQPWFLKKK